MIIILTWNWKLLCAQHNCLFSLPLILSLQTKVKSGCHSHPHLRAQTSGLTRSDFPICNNDPTLSTLLMTKKTLTKKKWQKKEKCSTKKNRKNEKKKALYSGIKPVFVIILSKYCFFFRENYSHLSFFKTNFSKWLSLRGINAWFRTKLSMTVYLPLKEGFKILNRQTF